MFCLIVAGIICIFMPLGTILGVFTIIVLVRPSVKAMFEGQATVDPENLLCAGLLTPHSV